MTTLRSKAHRSYSIFALALLASLVAVAILGSVPKPVSASAPSGAGPLTSIANAPNGGFWVQIDNGVY